MSIVPAEDPLELRPEFIEELNWQAVQSSNVLRLAWKLTAGQPDDPEATGDFYVDFGVDGSPKLYRYSGVSLSRASAVARAASVGGMLNKVIKPNFACDRVDIVPGDAATLEADDIYDEIRGLAESVGALSGQYASLSSQLDNIERGISTVLRRMTDLSNQISQQEEEHGGDANG